VGLHPRLDHTPLEQLPQGAAKPAAPKLPLLVLLAASVALDLLSFGFIALGIERAGQSRTILERGLQLVEPGWVPWSHGLVAAIISHAMLHVIWFPIEMFYHSRYNEKSTYD
jgi:hypothetical protein